ncbi:MAG: N-acetylmuramoyl-L-alanine amidase [Bacteroidales bacterium]|nr:N-acetylmuramoyl-L-alanine amidase [Bacteroidales bacterium]
MKKRNIVFVIYLLISILIFHSSNCFCSQRDTSKVTLAIHNEKVKEFVMNSYLKAKPYFQNAYEIYTDLPQGILEAVSYYYTRFYCVEYDENTRETLEEIPRAYGLMGLTLNGKGVFRENLSKVAAISKIPVNEILKSPEKGVLAYASAFSYLLRQYNIDKENIEGCFTILAELSELPYLGAWQDDFAVASYLYSVATFLNNEMFAQQFDFQKYNIDLGKLFGPILSSLQSPKVYMTKNVKENSVDYGNALWKPAGICNYVTMNSRQISSVAIHYTSGSYAGAIAWFQNCSYNGVGAQASAHYIVRSSDGQITQMVREKDKAWHVGSENGYTIGIEHEAYGDIKSYFTDEMYSASAALVRDICTRNGINPHRTFYRDTLDDGTCLNKGLHSLGGSSSCTKIRGHQHYPNQTHTDPGPFWDWNHYYKLLNPNPEIIKYTAESGVLTDSGGEQETYDSDERKLYLIEVPEAEKIELDFAEFDLEKDYDFLWIYDGDNLNSKLLGRWNTKSPGRVVSSGNSLLIEFRSDCLSNAAGWKATWKAYFPTVFDTLAPMIPSDFPTEDIVPTTLIDWDETKWQTEDFKVGFVDSDDYGLQHRFYQVMVHNGEEWTANTNNGFLCSNFDKPLNHTLWKSASGSWKMLVHRLEQYEKETENAWIGIPFNFTISDAYLYDVYVNFLEKEDETASAKIGFSVDDLYNPQNGYFLEIVPKTKRVRLFRLKNGVISFLQGAEEIYINENQNYLFRICYDNEEGLIKVFRHSKLLFTVSDAFPPPMEEGYFMLGTNKCRVAFDNVRAYRSRLESVLVTVGQSAKNDVRYQAIMGESRCKIKSVVLDSSNQFSSLAEKHVLVDFTPPMSPGVCVIKSSLPLSYGFVDAHFIANWPVVSDTNSPNVTYWYRVDEVGNFNSLVSSSKWFATSENSFVNEQPLEHGKQYQLFVRARNQAGLFSSWASSERFTYCASTPTFSSRQNRMMQPKIEMDLPAVMRNENDFELKVFPNPSKGLFSISGLNAGVSYQIFNIEGRMVKQGVIRKHSIIDISECPNGYYILRCENHAVRLIKY